MSSAAKSIGRRAKKLFGQVSDPMEIGFTTKPIMEQWGMGEKTSTPETLTAPVPDDDEAARIKERELARKYSNAGRAGTALTEGSKLG